MNQLVFMQDRKAAFIESLPKHIKNSYPLNGKDDYHVHVFAPFCHAYAAYLLNQGAYNSYGNFMVEFNEIIEQDEAYQYYEETQKHFTYGLAILSRNYEKMKLKDKRVPVAGNEFKLESDLENELFKAFKDYFGDELKVHRQEVLGYGKSDLTLNDNVAIELKKGKALRKDVYQTFEYSFEEKISDCCLIATDFEDKVIEIAEGLDVDCYTYSFIYEESAAGYPIGFWIEKVSSSSLNELDEILDEMDHAIYFTNYDPAFDFNKLFRSKFKELEEILEQTSRLVNENSKRILAHFETKGYDVSKGLKHLLEQVEAEEKTDCIR